jgi:two-component system sensor histidine kinase KdpD
VRLDPAFLDQILDNLLENVIRYAGPDAPLRIRVTPPADGRVRLTVEDGGPGVPEADLERVFEKFYRVTRRGPAAKAGSGVGLAVVRGFADAMGATVTARRSELGGLAVDLDLPLAGPATGDVP